MPRKEYIRYDAVTGESRGSVTREEIADPDSEDIGVGVKQIVVDPGTMDMKGKKIDIATKLPIDRTPTARELLRRKYKIKNLIPMADNQQEWAAFRADLKTYEIVDGQIRKKVV